MANGANLVYVPCRITPALTTSNQPNSGAFYRGVTAEYVGSGGGGSTVTSPVGPQRWPLKV